MISAYNFSLRGRDHKKYNMPCHDASLVMDITPSWKLAVVADGVGSCRHAEKASELASKKAAELIKAQFPASTSDSSVYESVILAAMHGAANAVESYVEQMDPGSEAEYQTTLTVAVMGGKTLYYGQAGDSGIVALDEDGNYHIVTEKQNDEEGSVYALPANRRFVVGTADFEAAAVLCLTDGVLDTAAPALYKGQKYPVDVPFANRFISYGLGLSADEAKEKEELCRTQVIEYLESDACSRMTDDLSAAVMVNTNSFLQEADIPWEEPDLYAINWKLFSIYPRMEIRLKLMTDYVRERNPEWNEEEILTFVSRYAGDTSGKEENEAASQQKEQSGRQKKMCRETEDGASSSKVRKEDDPVRDKPAEEAAGSQSQVKTENGEASKPKKPLIHNVFGSRGSADQRFSKGNGGG